MKTILLCLLMGTANALGFLASTNFSCLSKTNRNGLSLTLCVNLTNVSVGQNLNSTVYLKNTSTNIVRINPNALFITLYQQGPSAGLLPGSGRYSEADTEVDLYPGEVFGRQFTWPVKVPIRLFVAGIYRWPKAERLELDSQEIVFK